MDSNPLQAQAKTPTHKSHYQAYNTYNLTDSPKKKHELFRRRYYRHSRFKIGLDNAKFAIMRSFSHAPLRATHLLVALDIMPIHSSIGFSGKNQAKDKTQKE